MSENLDLVRSILEATERGDYRSVDWADPEIEYVQADGPLPGAWTGHTGLAEVARLWFHAWEDWRAEAEEYRELDAERVLVLIRVSGRGKGSGVEVGQLHAQTVNVLHVRGGKVTKIVVYFDRERALADLGLQE